MAILLLRPKKYGNERKGIEMEKPKTFVICKFADTVKLVFPDIIRMYYRIDAMSKEE